MPFIKRSIEPVKIRQGALGKADISLGDEHEVIVNHSYSKILLQLSQLATFANEIFTDLSQECKGVLEKTHKLKARVWSLDQIAQDLNVLETSLPESSLEEVAREVRITPIKENYQQTGLFTASSRPDSVQLLYEKADLTPRAVFASKGPPGWKAAKNFCLTPVLSNSGPTTITIDKPERREYKIVYERKDKIRPIRPRPKPAPRRPQSCSAAVLTDCSINTNRHSLSGSRPTLPTPEELVLKSAKSHPSVLIPIDTSMNTFDRLAHSRASLRNLQRSQEQLIDNFSRQDPRRKTISGPADLRRVSQQEYLSTEHLLREGTAAVKAAKPKNPDLYIEDTTEFFSRESRSKERKTSVISKLVKRSKSLPRNMGRSKTREMIVAPDFYEIHPQKETTIDSGILITDNDVRLYANFYGAPNVEQPSPELPNKLTKSKSDHQLRKSLSMMDDIKSKLQPGKRTRSLSAERPKSRSGTPSQVTEDKNNYNSLGRAFTGLFIKNRKGKTCSAPKTQSRDSINTVFTTSSDGETVRRKRLSTAGTTASAAQLSYRKRDSKATTLSSGRWSSSDRYSSDSDGLYGAASQNRLSRHSGDSAIGAEINDKHLAGVEADKLPNEQTERQSLYSVDQDGFYTSMHSECQLYNEYEEEDSLPNLSLLTSSTCTSTKTLNDIEKITAEDAHNTSTGSYPDSEKNDEISQRVTDKVNAGRSINRYSIVAVTDLDDEDNEPEFPDSHEETTPKSNLKQSQTYESELDLVLEEISDCDTMTLHSDSESVYSMKLSKETTPKVHGITVSSQLTNSSSRLTKEECPTKQGIQSTAFVPRQKMLNGMSKFSLLPSKQTTFDGSTRSCQSLPRNVRNVVNREVINASMDNMGSWPRKLTVSQANEASKSEIPSTDKKPEHAKRRSLSPGKLKSLTLSSHKDDQSEKVQSLIAEARRLSAMRCTSPPEPPQPPTPTHSSNHRLIAEEVSPYASINVIDPPSDYFIRQPSYKQACSNASPSKLFPRSQSDDFNRFMRRNCSYRKANHSSIPHQMSDSILEAHDSVESQFTNDSVRHFQRAPSYRMAQSQSFDRGTRAPSYRKALETISHEQDSGFGSNDMSSSTDSSNSDNCRVSSYRLATESNTEPVAQVLNQSVIRECMKGVYENEEKHLAEPSILISKPEFIRIDTHNSYMHHYATPRIPAKPTSFNPTYANSQAVCKSKQALKQSASAPHEDVVGDNSKRINGFPLRARPMSSYIPTEFDDELQILVPENKLMLPAYNKSNFTSIEMLKREELAVMSILGKIRQSTRPLSFVQTDI